MAKKKPARKAKAKTRTKTKKKPAPPRKAARSKKKAAPKRKAVRSTPRTGVAVVEVAEVDVITEPEEVVIDDEFPPDYGGSE
jgi:hypothetical protein